MKKAFTLSEVLITILVIGVVAALTLPVLIQNVTERINSNREANIVNKITQATDKMYSLGLMNGSYKSTDEFADELQKHLKIAKRCNASNISDCWPTETVTTSEGKEYNVSNATTGRGLNVKENYTKNVGLVLADGATILLTYNQAAEGMNEGEPILASTKTLPVGFGKSQEFAYTTSTTGAIDFVMDVNGKKGPNSETRNNKFYDIRSFKFARFSKGCSGIDVQGVGCVVVLGNSFSSLDTTKEEKQVWDSEYIFTANRWAGAVKACADGGMTLADVDTLKTLYKKRSEYPDLPSSGWFFANINRGKNATYSVNMGTGARGDAFKHSGDQALCIWD